MVKTAGRLVRRLIGLVVLVLVAYMGWKWGDRVFPGLEERLGVGGSDAIVVEDVESSEALGTTTLRRIETFLDGDEAELALSGTELTSLLRYARPDLIPDGLDRPTVRLSDGRAIASADATLAEFPGFPDLGPITGILPDPVSLELQGSVMGFGDGEAALMVQGMAVAGIPLPDGLIPEVLQALGRVDRPGLPAEAVAVQLPSRVESALVRGEHLILVAKD
jgi:hypothetical protein